MYNYTLSTWTPYSMYTLYILYYIYSFFHGVNAGFQHQSIHFLLGPITDRRHFQNRLNRITTGNTTLNGAEPSRAEDLQPHPRAKTAATPASLCS